MGELTIKTTVLTLNEIENLARDVFQANGCDHSNTEALVRAVVSAERDCSMSHGLFRVPGYITSLRSGKVNGHARPVVTAATPAIISVDGDNGYAPLALEAGLPRLASSAKELGIAAMKITNTYHFAALWPETEALAEQGLVGLACVCHLPVVAPAGGNEALFGTNPLSFAWPRPGRTPMVFDMATSSMAQGEVQIAARDGHEVPIGTGLSLDGEATTDPKKVLEGVLLPFGGYKGSAIAMMVELLAAGIVGDNFSYEAAENDNGDGGPARGGEFLLAISPERVAGGGWADHCEGFFRRYMSIDGTRLPGARRHEIRSMGDTRHINAALVEKIKSLLD